MGRTSWIHGAGLLAVVLGGSVALPAPSLGERPRAEAVRLAGVEGIGYAAEVEPGLYRGSQPSVRGIAWLKRLGVKTVINLRRLHGTRERHHVEAAGMDFEHLPMEASDPPSDAQVERFMALTTDPARRPIFVHCAQGVDRTGTMLAVYRMEQHGFSNDEALAEMVAFGSHGIWRDLRAYVRRYHPRGMWRAAGRPSPSSTPPVPGAP